MSLELVSLGTLTLITEDTLILRDCPAGSRVIVTFTQVEWSGERLCGKQKGILAGDWLFVGPEGTATLDIRLVLETPEGAAIYVYGMGRTDAATFATGGAVYFTPRFECADPRYAWLNKVQAVGKGSANGKAVTFEMFELR